MTDKRKIENRHRFRSLAFKLQTAIGDYADEIFNEMMKIRDEETDHDEKESMSKTLSSNIKYLTNNNNGEQRCEGK